MRPALLSLIAVSSLVPLVALGAGCKPASEPPRHAAGTADTRATDPGLDIGAPSGTVLIAPGPADVVAPPLVGDVVAHVAAGDAVATDTLTDAQADDDAVETSDAIDAGAAADADADTAAPGDADASDDSASDADAHAPILTVQLPEALISAVRAPVSAAAETRARRLNRDGLRRHRKLDLNTAIDLYLDALEAYPGHVFGNYNLACAYALTNRPDDALRHLAILSVIGDQRTQEKLIDARLDPDFDSMHDDVRFRELTGYTPVRVTWSPRSPRRSAAGDVAMRLRDAHIPAKVATTAWTADVTTPTIWVREGDPQARAIAREITAAAGVSGLVTLPSAALAADQPVVVVLAAHDDATVVVPTPAPTDGRATSVPDWYGKRLESRGDGTVAKLHLKHTTFFVWEVAESTGRVVRRTGRYRLVGGGLQLDFREVVETPSADPTRPDVTVLEDQQRNVPIEAAQDGLRVDGTLYRPRRP